MTYSIKKQGNEFIVANSKGIIIAYFATRAMANEYAEAQSMDDERSKVEAYGLGCIDQTPLTVPAAQPAVQEPVGYTDGDGRAWAVKWSGALPPNLTLFASAINHLQEKTMAKHIDPRKGGSKPRESP